MADKEVYVNGKKLGFTTTAKASPETNTSTEDTFDGPVNMGSEKVPWSLEISALRYGGVSDYKTVYDTVYKMLSIKGDITFKETVRDDSGNEFTRYDYFNGCITDGLDFEMKPNESTVEELKFKADKHTYEIN